MSEPVGSAEEHHGNLTPRAASASTGRRADAATHYRGLTDVEIAALESRGCRCARWQDVQVAEGFSAERVERVYFSGSVRIASQSGTVTFAGGLERPAGLYDSAVHNCTIGSDVCICGVGNLGNYDIADGVVIADVGTLVTDGETAFGNGTEIDVLNEGGGRVLKIFDRLSAQVAYLMVLYRHDTAMIEHLERLIDAHVAARRSAVGTIAEGCRITGCTSIVNVNIGPHVEITGALALREGTVIGCRADPTVIGPGVIANDFIVLSGSRVEDASILAGCFVGQGVWIGKQFSAENSVFFANCEGFHGEACSVFAGPYTVTHHKSTLLIAALFSFYNAGSATNQSNHMYKLGPLHQGILMRGAKTSSSSYALWPSRLGPFNVLVGKHMTNFDTSTLPFSYVNAVDERTVVIPAMNLFTVGTRRDSAKWPARDRRKDADKLDLINFDLFSPYIVKLTVEGIDDLKRMQAETPREKDRVPYKGAWIARVLLRKGAKHYDMVVRIFLGECLADLLESCDDVARARRRLAGLAPGELAAWADLAGMLAPVPAVEGLLQALGAGDVADIDHLRQRLGHIHNAYADEKLRWFAALLDAREGIDVAAATNDQLAAIVADWRDAALKLNRLVLLDAVKEFDPTSKIGFGIDGDDDVVERDFQAVRGTRDDNAFIQHLHEESEQIRSRAEALIERLAQP